MHALRAWVCSACGVGSHRGRGCAVAIATLIPLCLVSLPVLVSYAPQVALPGGTDGCVERCAEGLPRGYLLWQARACMCSVSSGHVHIIYLSTHLLSPSWSERTLLRCFSKFGSKPSTFPKMGILEPKHRSTSPRSRRDPSSRASASRPLRHTQRLSGRSVAPLRSVPPVRHLPNARPLPSSTSPEPLPITL